MEFKTSGSRPRILGKFKNVFDEISKKVFKENQGLYSFCIFLGFKYQIKLKVKDAEPIIHAHYLGDDEESCFYALGWKEFKNYSLLVDNKKSLEIMEEYANGGFQKLLDLLTDLNFVRKEEDKYLLETSQKSHIAYHILSIIRHEYEDN